MIAEPAPGKVNYHRLKARDFLPFPEWDITHKESKMNIYVGNLADDVNDQDLREVFEAFGQVESVNIIKDKFSGESKGFGFIEMPSKDEAQAAIKDADGTDLKGQTIKVNEARPRPSSGPRRGGGPRGGGFGGGGRGGRGGGGRGGGGRGGDRGGRGRY
ncbi:MAG: RNA recognition motif domain-containing protein [Planctomycetota bacterium]